MPNLLDLKPESRFFGMFISRSSEGKSAAAASFPKPIHYFDVDLRMRGVLACKEWMDLKDISYQSYPPRLNFYESLKNDVAVMSDMIKRRQTPTKTLVLASATSLCKNLLREGTELLEAAGHGGKKIGTHRLAGPEEYSYEASTVYDIFDILRGTPCNIIIDCHVITKFGKTNPTEKFSEFGPVGEELAIRDKIGANILIYFDECYRFRKDETGQNFFVQFRSDIARTAYSQLPNSLDITKKPFYPEWLKLVGGKANE